MGTGLKFKKYRVWFVGLTKETGLFKFDLKITDTFAVQMFYFSKEKLTFCSICSFGYKEPDFSLLFWVFICILFGYLMNPAKKILQRQM